MITKIVSALAKIIRDEYPEVKKIYRMTIEQELEPPAFFIHMIDTIHQEMIGGYYKQQYYMEVCFFPDESDPERTVVDLWEKAETLAPAFRYIMAGDQILTASNRPEILISDNVLHVQMEYVVRWERMEDGAKMAILNENIKAEGNND